MANGLSLKLAAAALALTIAGGCSATGGTGFNAQSAPSNSVSQEAVVQAFVEGLAGYCVRNILYGAALRDIEAEEGSLSRLTELTNPVRLRLARTDGPAYTLDRSVDVVMIDGDGRACRVHGYGPSARIATQAAAQATQRAWNAVMLESRSQPAQRIYGHTLAIDHEGRQAHVAITGNDPGAPGTLSRFSTIMAEVRAVEAKSGG